MATLALIDQITNDADGSISATVPTALVPSEIIDGAGLTRAGFASVPVPLPAPRVPIDVRAATLDDLAFIDGLQKKASKAVGFMPTKQLEGKIAKGEVLVAGATGRDEGGGMRDEGETASSSLRPHPSSLPLLGYLIGCDRYFKHDDVGIIYAINVVPEYRRSLVAATLLKAQFERSAYGCRLYCCWCAQDLAANRFWESMGFVPLAFRTGGTAQARTHLFWQKRIRSGDTSTPWWFPAQTSSGSIREDRLVLPIPPGTHWSDAKPTMLPGEARHADTGARRHEGKAKPRAPRDASALRGSVPASLRASPLTGLRLGAAGDASVGATSATREPRVKRKNDPRLVAAARELRDRWLEEVNDAATPLGAGALGAAKYDVARTIVHRPTRGEAMVLLPAA